VAACRRRAGRRDGDPTQPRAGDGPPRPGGLGAQSRHGAPTGPPAISLLGGTHAAGVRGRRSRLSALQRADVVLARIDDPAVIARILTDTSECPMSGWISQNPSTATESTGPGWGRISFTGASPECYAKRQKEGEP
jgi:hypothetical protein